MTGASGGVAPPWVHRLDTAVRHDPRRVAAGLFLPGQEPGAPGASRAVAVVTRCLALSDEQVDDEMRHVERQFARRHRDLTAHLEANFEAIAHRVPDVDTSPQRRRLIGACFTREVSVESAALFNPSVVAHPVQDGPSGSVRFVMSARAVGEGHYSTVVFRSGTFTPAGTSSVAGEAERGHGQVRLDPPSPFVETARNVAVGVPRSRMREAALRDGADPETLEFVLAELPEAVHPADLDEAVAQVHRQELTRGGVEQTVAALYRAARESYTVRFAASSALAERTLFPHTDSESHGMEDARLVRLQDADDAGTGARTATYTGTYTAYDGAHVSSRRLDTVDFLTFRSTALTGRAAANKGLALFPRRIDGRHLALSRWDRENNALATSDDGFHWDDAVELQTPSRAWELIQLGNCGPPLETPHGWLVLTHGVGPMRAYAMGALLLDLADPSRVIGRLDRPLLTSNADERDGYVPNVVYSCGAMLHAGQVLLPYGCSDTGIRFATVDLDPLIDALTAGPTSARASR